MAALLLCMLLEAPPAPGAFEKADGVPRQVGRVGQFIVDQFTEVTIDGVKVAFKGVPPGCVIVGIDVSEGRVRKLSFKSKE